jgi:hypothetical protein
MHPGKRDHLLAQTLLQRTIGIMNPQLLQECLGINHVPIHLIELNCRVEQGEPLVD